MEDFRKKAKKTIKIWTALIIAAIILWLGLGAAAKPAGVSVSQNGGGNGFCGMFILFMFFNISRYSAALKDDEKLKKIYITETDERSRLIREKADSAVITIVFAVLGFSALAASFFSETAFYTLIGVILTVALIQGACVFYYNKKF